MNIQSTITHARRRIVVFDTETTGLNPRDKILGPHTLDKWPYIVQLSFVVYDSHVHEIVQARDNYIQLPPAVVIPQECTNIHGVTNEMCETKGVPLLDAFNHLFHAFRSADVIVCHNVEFDTNMVKAELMRLIQSKTLKRVSDVNTCKHNLHFITQFKNFECTCTNPESIQLANLVTIGRNGEPFQKWPKLVELHQAIFQCSPTLMMHNSLFDVLITLRCYVKMKYDKDVSNTTTYKLLTHPNFADSEIIVG